MPILVLRAALSFSWLSYIVHAITLVSSITYKYLSMKLLTLIALSTLIYPFGVYAGVGSFTKGPLIKEYGANVSIQQTYPVSATQKFKVAFDVADEGKKQSTNRGFASLARFLNMHVRAGVLAENIELALVVHGSAGNDILNNKAYQAKFEADNPNLELIKILQKHNVKVFMCGQSAAYYGIKNEMLADGVSMSLSAMTAHALLQQEGYTLNPF